MALKTPTLPNLAEQAADWVMQLDEDATPEHREALVNWLRLSPRHIEEFLLAQATFRALHGMNAQQRLDVETLLAQHAANVVPIREPQWGLEGTAARLDTADTAQQSGLRDRWGRYALAAAVGALALFLGLGAWVGRDRTQLYTTAVGEQRTVRLTDGSLLYLNTHSRARMVLSQEVRRIELLEGEALFDVARDPRRPFVVVSGGAVIQAVGTQFNVYRRNGEIRVSVLEGRVRVTAAGDRVAPPVLPRKAQEKPAMTLLAAGEEARVTRQGQVVKHLKPNVENALAWRQRRLVFHGATLGEAVEQFNRYNSFQIELASEVLARRQISGVFHADDPGTILKFLQRDPTIQVEVVGNGAVARIRE